MPLLEQRAPYTPRHRKATHPLGLLTAGATCAVLAIGVGLAAPAHTPGGSGVDVHAPGAALALQPSQPFAGTAPHGDLRRLAVSDPWATLVTPGRPVPVAGPGSAVNVPATSRVLESLALPTPSDTLPNLHAVRVPATARPTNSPEVTPTASGSGADATAPTSPTGAGSPVTAPAPAGGPVPTSAPTSAPVSPAPAPTHTWLPTSGPTWPTWTASPPRGAPSPSPTHSDPPRPRPSHTWTPEPDPEPTRTHRHRHHRKHWPVRAPRPTETATPSPSETPTVPLPDLPTP